MHHGGRNRQACLQCSGQRSGLRQSFGDEAQLRSQSLGSALAPLWGYELGGATPQRLLDAFEKEIAPESIYYTSQKHNNNKSAILLEFNCSFVVPSCVSLYRATPDKVERKGEQEGLAPPGSDKLFGNLGGAGSSWE